MGIATEFAELGDKTSIFDIAFRTRNPRLSGGEVVVNLYIDVELQQNYRTGYSIDKSGIYYLSRRLCSQLDVATEKTNYGQLEKRYTKVEKHMIGLGLSIYEVGIEKGIKQGIITIFD